MAPLKSLKTRTFRIAEHYIGSKEPVLIIAEIGINHNGSEEMAYRLIDAAVEAKASAVKFQKRHFDSIYSQKILTNLEQQEHGFQYRVPIERGFELSEAAMTRLKLYCDKIGITFICTPFDLVSAAFLNSLNVAAYKISSADLTHVDLMQQIISYKKPVLLSTGMSLEHEVDFAVSMLQESGVDFALLHCVSSYPVDAREAKLLRIRHLIEKYGCLVGYSGHDIGTALSVVAVSLGASIIEKHFTLDKTLRGPDHKLSLLPNEFARLVANIRDSELALTEIKDRLLQGEVLNKMVHRKSIVAARPISRGEVITREMLTFRSPGTGLTPQRLNEVVGCIAVRDFGLEELIREGDLAKTSAPIERFGLGWGKWGVTVRYHDFEKALTLAPEVLEFHMTYDDTLLQIPYELFEKHREQLSRLSLRVHCCEYIGERLFDLCSDYPDVLTESQAVLQRVINITSDLSRYFAKETPLVVFNVGAMSLRLETRETEIDKQAFYRIIKKLDLQNTRLIAQNMAPDPWYFGGQWKSHYMYRPDELIEFAEETGHGICLDISHAKMACQLLNTSFEDYIVQIKPYVEHIHISDAHSLEGEGLEIGAGDINFEKFFELYDEYSGTWIPEIWLGHVNNNEGFKTALRKLANIRLRVQPKRRIPVRKIAALRR